MSGPTHSAPPCAHGFLPRHRPRTPLDPKSYRVGTTVSDVNRRGRLAAFVGVVALAVTLASVVAGRLFPALGVPDLYGTAVTSAVGAVIIASFWVLLGDGFDDAGYLVPGRVVRDLVVVAGSALFVAATLVAVMDATGLVDGSVRAGEAFVAAGPRLVATAAGVGAGVYAFHRRNRARFAR